MHWRSQTVGYVSSWDVWARIRLTERSPWRALYNKAMTAVTDRPRMLWVQSQVDDSGDVLVSVRDSGIGLGSEADRVFTPFFTTKANGMGMGLSISRSLIESHGGRLWATPNDPHGTVFSFTLPVDAGDPS
jgi:signal transduction histidine kinase